MHVSKKPHCGGAFIIFLKKQIIIILYLCKVLAIAKKYVILELGNTYLIVTQQRDHKQPKR